MSSEIPIPTREDRIRIAHAHLSAYVLAKQCGECGATVAQCVEDKISGALACCPDCYPRHETYADRRL